MNKKLLFAAIAAVPFLAAAQSALAQDVYRTKAIAMLKKDFSKKGQADVDRLEEDAVQAVCNQSGNMPPADIAKRMEADQMQTVKFPADGKLMGDWKKGEKIAQNGKGFTWRDKPGPIGGACYNCHQIGPNEQAYGTIGTSLYQIGKIRGFTRETREYVYAKIYNAKAFNLCSDMPRFGHIGALTEENIKDLVALLTDPASPVNQ